MKKELNRIVIDKKFKRGIALLLTFALFFTSLGGTGETIVSALENTVSAHTTARSESQPGLVTEPPKTDRSLSGSAVGSRPDSAKEPIAPPAEEIPASGSTAEPPAASGSSSVSTSADEPTQPPAQPTESTSSSVTAESITLTGTVVFMDDGSVSRTMPVLQIYDGSTQTGATFTLMEAPDSPYAALGFEAFTYTSSALPKTDASGKEIVYTLRDEAYGENSAQALFFVNEKKEILAQDTSEYSVAAESVSLLYIGLAEIKGSLEVDFSAFPEADAKQKETLAASMHSIKLNAFTLNADDAQFAAQEAALHTADALWSAGLCLQYNPLTGGAISHGVVIAENATGFTASYPNTDKNGKQYALNGEKIVNAFLPPMKPNAPKAEGKNTINGVLNWKDYLIDTEIANEYWTELCRPTQVLADQITIYGYSGNDAAAKKQINLQMENSNADNYIRWGSTSSEFDDWKIFITNLDVYETYSIETKKLDYYEAAVPVTIEMSGKDNRHGRTHQ